MPISTKTKMPVAIEQYSKITDTPTHVTTSDFMQFQVAYCTELVPNQKYNLRHELFTRLEALVVPTFGEARIQNRIFWVPMRTIFPAWNDFINDTPHQFNNGSTAIVSTVPLITNQVLVDFYSESTVSEGVANSTQAFDIYIANNGVTQEAYRKLTPFGRYCDKILRALGYAPIFNRNVEKTYSIMPILALFKAYVDFYFPSQYAHSTSMDIFTSFLNKNDEPSATASFISHSALINAFQHMRNVCYDADYFTSAWDNPAGPNQGLFSPVRLDDVTVDGYPKSSVTSYDTGAIGNGTPVIRSYSSATGSSQPTSQNTSQYVLTALQKATDYAKRNQISGARSLDRYYSRFGVRLPDEKLNRCSLINSYSQNIQFGDVVSTADTEGAHLGQMGGRGLSYGDNYTQFDTNGEYGYLIVISTILPKIDYYQGIDRHILHQTKFDFYTPEYDALGPQAISSMELYVPRAENVTDGFANTYKDQVFGFTPRYAEYKKTRSLITGDYIQRSMNAGLNAWTLFRNVNLNDGFIPTDFVHSLDFIRGADADQYNRIFWNTSDTADHFNIIHRFEVESIFPGKSLFDDYDFSNEDKSESVVIDRGGTQVN